MTEKYLIIEPGEGYTLEIGRWLWALEDTRRRTKEALAGIQPETLDWDIREKSNSIGSLLFHVAAIEMSWLYEETLEQDFPPEVKALLPYNVRDDAGQFYPVKGLSLEEHLQRLDVLRGYFLAAFKGMTVAEFRRPRHLEAYSVTPEWIIHHLMQHEAEHRGQIMELRLLVEAKDEQ